MIGFRSKAPPASVDALDDLAALLDGIPEQWRQFLLRHDGAVPEANLCTGHQAVGVASFLSIAEVRRWLETYRNRIPDGFVPIADADGGNLVLLSVGDPHAGDVWFWDHEMESEEDEAPYMDNVTQIASSFDEFVHLLRPRPDPAPEDDGVVSAWIDPAFVAELESDDPGALRGDHG